MKSWGEENAPHQWLHRHSFHCNIVTSKAVEIYLKKKIVIKLSRSLSEPVQPCVTSELSPIRKDDRHSEAVQQSLPHSFHFLKHVHIQQPGLVWALSQNLGGRELLCEMLQSSWQPCQGLSASLLKPECTQISESSVNYSYTHTPECEITQKHTHLPPSHKHNLQKVNSRHLESEMHIEMQSFQETEERTSKAPLGQAPAFLFTGKRQQTR